MRKTIIVLLALSIMISSTGLATATSLESDEQVKIIPQGTCDTFTLTLNTSYSENGKLSFVTDYPLTAQIDGYPASLATTGQTPWTAFTKEMATTHSLYVRMDAGAPDGEYDIDVSYFGQVGGGGSRLRAWTQPTAATPELTSTALMSIGLIGLFGLVSMKRRKI